MAAPTFDTLSHDMFALRNPTVDEPLMQRYVGTSRTVLGVKTEAQRKLARTAEHALPAGDEGDALWLALLDDLYASPIFDHRTLAGHLIHARPAARKGLDLQRLRGWVGDLEGWCEVDCTCQSDWSAAEVLARWEEWAPFLTALSGENRTVLRRASLVLLLQSVRDSADARLSDLAFATIARVEQERDPLITKAVSWLLRALIIHHPEAVAAYLDEHAATLPAIALRETRRKLETGRK